MSKIHLLFYLFTAVTTAFGQSKKKEHSANFSLNQLLENVNSISLEDRPSYKKALKVYLHKAKETQNNDHLLKAYLFHVFYDNTPEVMHKYTDSIYMYAKKTQQTLNIIKAHQTRSTVYYIEKNFKKSLEYELAALQLIDKENHAYEYYKTLYSIGLTHFYLQQYHEASKYFVTARSYFEKKSDYNHLQGYMNSIRYEALSSTLMSDYAYSNELIQKGLENLTHINKNSRALEKAYFDYVYGINLYHLKSYSKSIDVLKGTLAEIKKNEDYANEHNVYYYLGLNELSLGHSGEAIIYFNHIDRIFKEKRYSNLEIKNAYSYLINHYKKLKNEEMQLYYTNQLLKVTLFLQNEYRYLSSTLHKQLDIKHLETEKERLENSLRMKDFLLYSAIALGGIAFTCFLVLYLRSKRREKEYLKRYDELTALRKSSQEIPTLIPEVIIQEPATTLLQTEKAEEAYVPALTVDPLFKREDTCNNRSNKCSGTASDKTLSNLLVHLQDFEDNHAFLEKDINLNQLATRWNTNRSYLSTLINQHKGRSFTDYVNKLRVDYILEKLDTEPVWREYKISHLSDITGFSSGRSFANAFLKVTGMSPSFYLQKLRSDEKA